MKGFWALRVREFRFEGLGLKVQGLGFRVQAFCRLRIAVSSLLVILHGLGFSGKGLYTPPS